MPGNVVTPQKLPVRQPFSILHALYGDRETGEIFSLERTVGSWLDTEAALARAQASTGVLENEVADAIEAACSIDHIDLDELWESSRKVGYPILALVRMIAAQLPDGPNGRVHLGATTQDIMDTGLAIQMDLALTRLESLTVAFGGAIDRLVALHANTVMAARTHGQQAVPTTFGSKMAVFLDELTDAIGQIRETRAAVSVVSLYGAGGTSAALGTDAHAVRVEMGRLLGLAVTPVSWHVARDRLVRFGTACALVATIAGRFAREVIGLSRTEIGELKEAEGYLHGASSTMPQKANPAQSEAIVGFAATAQTLVPALYRGMEATHERAAGEWQIEWTVVPQLALASASAVGLAVDVASGLVVDPERMRKNMEDDKWMLMAEAYMMGLAVYCGRERAHEIVYHAAARARDSAADLSGELVKELEAEGLDELSVRIESMIAPESYLGDFRDQCDAARSAWQRSTAGNASR